MRNRVTDLFGVDVPIVQAGMVWCAGHRLAAAVSVAGGLGVIGAGSMRPDLLLSHIRQARQTTHRPIGVNVPLLSKYADELVEVCVQERVSVVVTSAGSPRRFTERLHQAGAVVAHVVPNVALARKCEAAGVDAVVAEGVEAGGHNGPDELTTLVLVPQVVDAVRVPVLAAGGIGDGRAMAAAFALGAEGVQVGSRFVACQESSAHPGFKAAVVAAGDTATRLVLRRAGPVRLIMNDFGQRVQAMEAAGASREELLAELGVGRARRGMFEGDLAEGELEIGQVAGLVRDIETAADILRGLLAGYAAAVAGLPAPPPRTPTWEDNDESEQ